MYYYNKYCATFILVLIVFSGCYNKQTEKIEINRFEQEFFSSEKSDLKKIIKKYPFLFPINFDNNVWESYLVDSTRISTFKKTNSVFNNMDEIQEQISISFNLIESTFSYFKKPKVITLNSQDEYKNRIIYADSLLLISLDQYLGSDYYPSIPSYISNNMTKKYVTNDISQKISEKLVPPPSDRSLLAEMIYHGKVIFLTNLFTPYNENHLKFHSTKQKINWAHENEKYVWAFFVENDLLFSTEQELKSRFISFAPFSKFNLEIDKYSPGSIGKWLGYRIVDSYMKNNNIEVSQLPVKDFYEIFSMSNYKPKK